jgi:DeoR/GlpR family transcriptional regulator of sugar metabolism
MLKEERQQYILERLKHDGKALASDLETALKVSEDTIRRDLRELAELGLLQRVHGGALPRSPAATTYHVRHSRPNSTKIALAIRAVQLIRSGQVIILDGGTTTLEVAQHLPSDLHATIITNSPPVAVALSEHPLVEVIVIGGTLLKDSVVTVGSATVEALYNVRADLCMLGICSLHPEVGISVPDYEEAHVKLAMITNSAEVVALASSEKLGTAAPHVVAPLSELTHLITDADVPDDVLQPYAALGITILRAG